MHPSETTVLEILYVILGKQFSSNYILIDNFTLILMLNITQKNGSNSTMACELIMRFIIRYRFHLNKSFFYF